MVSLRRVALVVATLALGVRAEYEPKINDKEFSTVPMDLFYFDDTKVVLGNFENALYRSEDSGASWQSLQEPFGKLLGMDKVEVLHTSYTDLASGRIIVLVANSTNHLISDDKGSSWRVFSMDELGGLDYAQLSYNHANPDWILLEGSICTGSDAGFDCNTALFYTKDAFKTEPFRIQGNYDQCMFTHSTDRFKAAPEERIFCIERMTAGSRIVYTDDFFKTTTEASDASNSMNAGEVFNIEVIGHFIVAEVSQDKYAYFGSVNLYVSLDGATFTKIDFGSDIKKHVFQFIDTSSEFLTVVMYGYKNSMDRHPTAEIYQSDSSGLHYNKLIDNVITSDFGFTSAVKVDTIDGAWVVNQINESGLGSRTLISIDNGKTWNPIVYEDDKCTAEEGCELHLYSLIEQNEGFKMSTGPTPGILLALGEQGSATELSKNLNATNTYISRDGGVTWKWAFKGPSLFSFGDQGNIIMAINVDMSFLYGESMVFEDTVRYSTDQGISWKKARLPTPVWPLQILTTTDGSSKSFILAGISETKGWNGVKTHVLTVDFSDALERTCGDTDFEEWYARVDPETSKPICVFGHVEKFKRRKQDADCFVNKLFADVVPIEEPCVCTEKDFECALGFVLSSEGECEPHFPTIAETYCSDPKKKLKLSSKVKFPGSLCREKGGFKPAKDDFSISCADAIKKTKIKDIVTVPSLFSDKITNYFYLKGPKYDPESPPDIQDETILLSTSGRRLYVSYNGGLSFDTVDSLKDADGKLVAVYTNPYFTSFVYVITSDSKIYISEDGALTFRVVDAPTKLNEFGIKQITFNKRNPDSFIWYGEKGCKSYFSKDCHVEASYTTDGGESFLPLVEDVRTCHFVGSTLDVHQYKIDENLIFCEKFNRNSQFFQLISTTDFFNSEPKVLFDQIVGFADTGEFIIVAEVKPDQSLTASVTVDGSVFAVAEFPSNFKVDRQQAYTVMDVSSKSIFLHVTTSSEIDRQFGTILKSNYNGTSYVVSLPDANRDNLGYVDFEKVETLEGISVVNVVANAEKVKKKNEKKKLKTKITHNDGAEWSFVQPPPVDSKGKPYGCKGKSLKDCSLNLHGYTERTDIRDTYSSGSAVGMMIATGNVGEFLLPSSESSTFFTEDAGATWKEIQKGAYTWEFGDQGSIIVLVKPEKEQTKLLYSLDHAETWQEYEFSKDPVKVIDLGTVPSDVSKKFVILAENADKETMLFTVDFSKVFDKQCTLDLENPTAPGSDFEYWSPKHPFLPDNCLFGHESAYLRRKAESSHCFIGQTPLYEAFKVIRNCSCSRKDYECDYNYAMAEDGTCKLVPGLKPLDPTEQCRAPDALGYFEPTGYRKIPLSTCESGLTLDKWTERACPGKEGDFHKQRGSGVTGFGLFAVIFVPLIVFLAATWFVYDRGIRRNGGFSRFGEIRLDEDDELHLIEETTTDVVVNSIVRGAFNFTSTVIQTIGVVRNFLRTTVFRLGSSQPQYTRFSGDSFFEDESLFANEDDDAQEIDQFLDEGFDDFESSLPEPSHDAAPADADTPPASAEDFQVDDEDDGDLGTSR